jgi:hypothetical protein
MNTLKTLMAVAALALAIGSASASAPDRPISLQLTLRRAETGWHVAIEGNSFFRLTSDNAYVELNSQGYAQLRYSPLSNLPDVPPTVLPIRVLPGENGGWKINFFGLKLNAEKTNSYSFPWMLRNKYHLCGDIFVSDDGEIRVTLDSDSLLPIAAEHE